MKELYCRGTGGIQCIIRLDVVKVFAIFTEKETVKEGLKDNLDVTLQRFTEDSGKCRWCHRLKRVARSHFGSEQS